MPGFRVKKLNERAIIPNRAHPTDSGLDLYALNAEDIYPGEWKLVETGIAVEIPHGYGGFILPRSGWAAKYGITVTNAPGLIDADYRGDVGVILQNTRPRSVDNSDEWPFEVNEGDRIAQLIIVSIPLFSPVEVEELASTKRGKGGFGSTNEGTK